jgi:hypothetical protein
MPCADCRAVYLAGNAAGHRARKNGCGQHTWRQPQPSYFKLPVDCDDEESLEERRGRTVLRTAM